ncbi:hypothetical protein [Niabella beijingensis]|uniref:hypothetical protein n=1 Tax=Niabella beijingensis TaxID=2872700 RepID=UPI001CBAFA0D|nr:hypothetical protein [Niabella beijingensis]MBZ4190996.1 hypothetical protein [Niabella beijingensis]
MLCAINAGGQTNKEAAFKRAALKIITLYNKKDTKAINQYIHKSTGVFILGSLGATSVFQLQDSLCLSAACTNTEQERYVYQKMMREQKYKKLPSAISNSEKPVFECETIYRQGLFRMLKTAPVISSTIETSIRVNKNVPGESLEEQELQKLKTQLRLAKDLEKKMRVVVFTTKEKTFWGGTFIFGMNYIDGKWCLTLLDFLSNDCSV